MFILKYGFAAAAATLIGACLYAGGIAGLIVGGVLAAMVYDCLVHDRVKS